MIKPIRIDNSYAWPDTIYNFVKYVRCDPRENLRVAYICRTCSQAILFNGTEGSEVGRELRTHAAIHHKAKGEMH